MPDMLKPCPFCGSSDVILVDFWAESEGDDNGYAVRCNWCNALGPYYEEDKRAAIVRWNRRAKERTDA